MAGRKAEPIDTEPALRTDAARFFSAADRHPLPHRPALPRVHPPRRWLPQLGAVRRCAATPCSTAHPTAPAAPTVACVRVPRAAAPVDVFLPARAAREAAHARPRHYELHVGGRSCANDKHQELRAREGRAEHEGVLVHALLRHRATPDGVLAHVLPWLPRVARLPNPDPHFWGGSAAHTGSR